MTNDTIRLRRSIKLYELIITWYDGRHCNTRTIRFWADPCEYREEALRLFLISFRLSNANADSAREQWFHGNGQIVLPWDNRVFYEPKQGQHQLMCVDGYGRSSSIKFQVQ